MWRIEGELGATEQSASPCEKELEPLPCIHPRIIMEGQQRENLSNGMNGSGVSNNTAVSLGQECYVQQAAPGHDQAFVRLCR